ncbi:MAG: hypothetical protein JGK17_27855 [Microcoleus sp. PH2017_10_PVI_O_A]|uniref:hypothetical protein n=1 Tax=unclassified Microcoleus TaxID=2642155 RepID=UPI001D3B380B|nr:MULTISPECIES: hypothetical protein [unclassified Microcoleus]MCC3409306.1 hypothetical protein [Microcoleus sp. PH2017_10_PVI_O_A]MCC3463551.1 hypothetical protein [Microcoleus sp. PH2017_11_PCY_U_A]MCC3481885.1 hypothetical protein [Microcoleus sp. PH2017_12_PCY_D_A]MCC3531822.1 hypothetical protein [Microcoleus sp. PH2017_21_RUC_O_A]MCC3544149.1 hypothetical protein [Microcoleus sp. PH2017_22_RUC_O_B]
MMLRKLTIYLMALTFLWTATACGSPRTETPVNPGVNNNPAANRNVNTVRPAPSNNNNLSQGQYPVQQATYNDADGEYSLMLLNTPPGSPPVYRTTDLQMARLTDEEISAGKKSYLSLDNNKPVLHLTEDFKIEYVHNVTETVNNPQTGQPQTVVVRQQSGFWAPFAGALAGQAIGSLLFTPRYYVPPFYQPGIMTGYGGYGNTYRQAVNQYQTRYQAPPPAVRNRQVLRTTGRLRSPASKVPVRRPAQPGANRSTGSGYGGSTLRRSQPGQNQNRRSPSFGSGRSSRQPSRSRSFGSGRRR